MIEKFKSVQTADKVLKQLLADDRAKDVDAYITMFENGREQGYKLSTYALGVDEIKTIAFSEHKVSDDIVVYHSTKNEGVVYGYSDEFWVSQKGFRYNNVSGAVDYIFELLMSVND